MFELSPEMWCLLMFLGLLAGLFAGHPIAVVLGGVGIIFGFLGFGINFLFLFMGRIYEVMDNYVLISVPLFIFMAQLLSISKVSDGLFDSFRYLFGSLNGGMGIAVVLVSVLFGACTGLVGASVVSMGLMAMPTMLKRGYSKEFSSGLICSGGTLGILIPPSIMLIIMSSQAGISVGKILAGAVVPGCLLALIYLLYVIVSCWINPGKGPAMSKEDMAAITTKEKIRITIVSLVPPMILIIGVLGSIFVGIATPTEAAGVGALLSFILTVVYRKFSFLELKSAVLNTAKATSMVFFMVVGATCFVAVFLAFGGGEIVKNIILGAGLGKWGTLIIMMLVTSFLGMFLDWVGIVMLVFPVFLPIASELGFDLIWFVVITAVLLQDSFISPPFGYALFYLKGVAPNQISMNTIIRGVIPFWLLMKIGLITCIVFPGTVTWLANMVVK